MDILISAVVGDLISRSASFLIKRCWQEQPDVEESLQRLNRLLLRVHAVVEEAEGRYITNQAMLRQLKMLTEGMYSGHYMLDTLKYQALQGIKEGDEEVIKLSALSRFNPAKRVRFSGSNENRVLVCCGGMKELQQMVDTLENVMGDMKEFVIFLQSYPRMRRQPYCTYLLLDNCMFCRQMERDRVLNFLLQADDAPCTDKLAVLPIVGPIRVGKSTLVENVCKDERVRNRFSEILFFREKDEAGTNLSENGLVKHQNSASHERLLIVIELAGDMDEETWRRLNSRASCMSTGSKIIITSRSNNIARLGTTEPLRLEHLPPEAYWHFFKMLAFGSTDPDEQPRLASMAMEIAMEQRQCFVSGYIVAGLLRENLSAQFWRAVLQRVRAYKQKHLLLFDEHPNNLLRKDEPVYYWRMGETSKYFLISSYYQTDSIRDAQVPKVTVHDVLKGSATPHGKFEALGWMSRLPPYYNYMISCVMQEPGDMAMAGRKKRVQRKALDLRESVKGD